MVVCGFPSPRQSPTSATATATQESHRTTYVVCIVFTFSAGSHETASQQWAARSCRSGPGSGKVWSWGRRTRVRSSFLLLACLACRKPALTDNYIQYHTLHTSYSTYRVSARRVDGLKRENRFALASFFSFFLRRRLWLGANRDGEREISLLQGTVASSSTECMIIVDGATRRW